MSAESTIFDFGANNGDDLPYYLQKSRRVVAIEANPVLCKKIADRFAMEIAEGRLFVENCVALPSGSEAQVRFYIHRSNDVLSQFPRPDDDVIHDFEEITLPSRSIPDIISQYGSPHYIKIDVEHFDAEILESLFSSGIYPPYLSAESHDIRVFAMMVASGRYNAFKLVDGFTVSEKFANHPIATLNGPGSYSFPYHSAGPFGEDLPGGWMSANSFFRLLALEGLGWKDIHATTLEAPNPSIRANNKIYLIRSAARSLPAILKRAVLRATDGKRIS